MSQLLPDAGLAKAIAFALIFGFLGIACAFQLAVDLVTVAAGKTLPVSSEDDDEDAFLHWPRDRFRIVAQFFIHLAFCAVFAGLSCRFALRALGSS